MNVSINKDLILSDMEFNKNNNKNSLLNYYRNIIRLSILITILGIISLVLFLSNSYSSLFFNQVNNTINLIENELDEQIENASHILNRASENLSFLLENKSPNENIERFLFSLEPRNLRQTYWSIFILTDKECKFKASSKFFTDKNINEYNKTLLTRNYILESKNNPSKIQIGEIISGIQTKKLSIPIGLGFTNQNNEYLGTILTGLVIEEFVIKLQNQNIPKIQFFNSIPDSKSITLYNKYSFFKDIIFSLEPIHKISYKLKLVPAYIELSIDRKVYAKEFYSSLSKLALTLTLIIVLLYNIIKYFYKKIIHPIETIGNQLNLIEDTYKINWSNNSTYVQPIEIQKIEAIIKRLLQTDDELRQVKSIVKFLSQEKINEIEKSDPKGSKLFDKVKQIYNFVNIKAHDNENYSIPSELIQELYNSIEDFYSNINASKDQISWELFKSMDELSKTIEENNSSYFSDKFLNFSNSIRKFYQSKSEMSPYILNQEYFTQLEEPAYLNIAQIIENITNKYNYIKKSKYNSNINDSYELNIRKRAFELCIIYVIESLENYLQEGDNLNIEAHSGKDNKDNFNLTFYINSYNNLENNFKIFDKNNSSLEDKVKINLYGAKIFAAFNGGEILFSQLENNLMIKIEFINNMHILKKI